MKWFTCTPVAFGGGEDFFARDSGLLSRGFRSLGIESRAVMPGRRRPDDLDELIRTDAENLESASWWKSHDLDGVVLYAWGRPKFRRVATAIGEAGIPLVLNQDSGGFVSPRCGWEAWFDEQRVISGRGRVPGGWLRQLKLVSRGLTLGLLITDPLRARHLQQGTWITAVSPGAAEAYRRLCTRYVGHGTGERVAFVPHPVDPRFAVSDGTRGRRIVAVGRWDDERQKRTSLLIQGIDRLLARDSEVEFDVVGTVGEPLDQWHRGLADAVRRRVVLHGRIVPEKLVEVYRGSRILWCPSAFESFHIASAEALCCGGSVVAARSGSLASFDWFTAEGDGRLAERDDAEGHARALLLELGAWDRGERRPQEIGGRWAKRLHAPEVARRILDLCGQAEGIGVNGLL
jgi:glycosyltransferase involved in cell wall biosynthesis